MFLADRILAAKRFAVTPIPTELEIMGTRSNFYKTCSLSYKKDVSVSSVLQNLRAYNIAIGNAPPVDPQPPIEEENRVPKRRRLSKTPSRRGREIIGESDGPMSHEDYIAMRREEVSSSQAYEELPADVLLGNSSGAGVKLVGYDSDGSTSSECKASDVPTDLGQTDEADRVKSRREQRFPDAGEPVCVMCGRYGEYICNETDDDICSLECKAELLESLKNAKQPPSNQIPDLALAEPQHVFPLPDLDIDTWDYERQRWSKRKSILCTYKCWKCNRPGHLAEDCLVATSNQVTRGHNKKSSISRGLHEVYRRCHQIGKNLAATRCNTCCSSISLARCLDCDAVLCDNAGHLNNHIRDFPSHQQYYSHKLKRLVKCCKLSCGVTSIKELMVCHYCFNKAFDRYYDMFSATWKVAGLSIIQGSICCEDHFAWHRMNCLNADVEDSAYIINGNIKKGDQLNDFIF